MLELIFGAAIVTSIVSALNGSDNDYRPTKKDLARARANDRIREECWEYACEQQRKRLNANNV